MGATHLDPRIGWLDRRRSKPRGHWRPCRVLSYDAATATLIDDLTGNTRTIPVRLVEIATRGPKGERKWKELGS